jgi:signal transduction histidine kinase
MNAADRLALEALPQRQVRASSLALLVAACVGFGLLSTALTFSNGLAPLYRSQPLHAAIETAVGMIALLAAYLVFGRFLQQPHRHLLATCLGLAALGLTNLVFAVPASTASPGHDRTVLWTHLIQVLFGASVLAAGAFQPDAPLQRPLRAAASALAGTILVLVAIHLIIRAAGGNLPMPLDDRAAAGAVGRLQLDGPKSILAFQVLGAALFATAAVGFGRRAATERNELMEWLAAGAILAAFGRINYVIFPSIFTSWVYTGDFLRLAGYALVLVGATREIRRYQLELAEAAAREERRKVARDLHDELAQDLAFIAMQTRLAEQGGAPEQWVGPVARTAERALETSRSAIGALTNGNRSLRGALGSVAEDVALRSSALVHLDLATGPDPPEQTVQALSRIVREAAWNAIRHGEASAVTVRVRLGSRLRLSVIDNGSGFDPLEPDLQLRGFGLTSMRERAEGLGGELRVLSERGRGTTIEVELP